MTNEEAIAYITQNCYGEWCEDNWRDAMDMAIKALELCDDISKQLDCKMFHSGVEIEDIDSELFELPSVQSDPDEKLQKAYEDGYKQGYDQARFDYEQPERKNGEWLHGREVGREMISDTTVKILYEDWRCSNCGWVWKRSRKPTYNYCPNCGFPMER